MIELIELIELMVLVSVLAVSALPALTGSVGMRDVAWHDAALGALRHARSTAMAHRRVVCLSVCLSFSGNAVSLTMASSNPAVSCDLTLASLEHQRAPACQILEASGQVCVVYLGKISDRVFERQ